MAKIKVEPTQAKSSSWVRALVSGMMIHSKPLGSKVHKGELLCLIADPLGDNEIKMLSPYEGLIIGKTNIPLINEGDALFHIALFDDWEGLQLALDDPEIWD